MNKMIWFMWTHDSKPKLVLQRGAYKLRIHFWTMKGAAPHTVEHEFVVGDAALTDLEGHRVAKRSTTVSFWLDKELEQNRAMTSDEAKKLLGISA